MKDYVKYYHGIDPVVPVPEVKAEVILAEVEPVDPDIDHIIEKDFLEYNTRDHLKANRMQDSENRAQGYR